MRTVAALLVVGLACGLVFVGVVAAHGDHVQATNQISGDGSVVIESALLTTVSDGFVVVHANDRGQPGEPVGHVAVDGGYTPGVEVQLDGEFWASVDDEALLWVALYEDTDGNGEFDPETDQQLEGQSGEAQSRFVVERGDGSVNVVGGFGGQTAEPKAVVTRAELDSEGYLVLHRSGPTGIGEVVGAKRLPAGTHEDVTVDLDEEFFAEQRSPIHLAAMIYRDDGGGEFPESERVTVGDRPIMAFVAVEKVEGGGPVDTPTPSPTPDDGDPGTTAGNDGTPANNGGTTAGDDGTPTGNDGTTAGNGDSTARTTEGMPGSGIQTLTTTPDGGGDDGGESGGGLPGFGFLVAVVALLVAAGLAWRR